MSAIVTYDLTKQFDNITAVSGIDLQIPFGQRFACVGGEKSGKTTLVRLLSGLLRPTSGECSVMACSPSFEADKLHSAVGTVINSARLYENMTLSENLRFFAGIYGIDENDALDRISFLLHKLDIWEGRDIKINKLPTSVLRRGSLARALVHKPKLLLIDEIADSIDKDTAESVKSLLDTLVDQEGLTVFLATHNMEYAELLCDNFALLSAGRIIARGDMSALHKDSGLRFRAKLRLADSDAPPAGSTFADGFWQKEILTEEALSKLIAGAVNHGRTVYEARLEKPSLREIYAAYLNGGEQKAGETDEQNDEFGEWAENEPTTEPTDCPPTEPEQNDTDSSDFGPLDPEVWEQLRAIIGESEADPE